MPRDISYSDGSTVKNAVVVVWEDLHEERAGFYRAFWADGPEGTCGSPVLRVLPGGRDHRGAGRKTTLRRNVQTEADARAICKAYNDTHAPGFLSRKAEYEEQ